MGGSSIAASIDRPPADLAAPDHAERSPSPRRRVPAHEQPQAQPGDQHGRCGCAPHDPSPPTHAWHRDGDLLLTGRVARLAQTLAERHVSSRGQEHRTPNRGVGAQLLVQKAIKVLFTDLE